VTHTTSRRPPLASAFAAADGAADASKEPAGALREGLARVLASSWGPLLLTLAWLAATIWARPLAVPDEGRYAGVAWSMLTGGDWLTPHLNGLPYFHKPPLFYWITGASLAVFGPHEWAARAAPLFGAALGTTSIYLFARRWFGEREARLALLALATQPLFFLGSQFANLDMLVAGCIAATVAALAHAALLELQGQRSRKALAAAWFFAALGVLAKGLIGFVLPGMILFFWALLLRRPWLLLRLFWLPGIALFLAVAAPWFIAMQQRFPGFSHYFFIVQHFDRFSQGGFNNRQPFWFYLAVLGLLALPWSAWVLAGRSQGPLRDPQGRHLRQLLWLWVAVPLVFFSLPSSKLVGYIFPATVPLALLAAQSFARRPQGARSARLWQASAVVAMAACVVGVSVAALRPHQSMRELARTLGQQVQPNDRVVFLDGYYFDIEFYARLHAPTYVVDDWAEAAARQRDNWHGELKDAAQFDPAEGQRLLLDRGQLAELHCGTGATWVIGVQSLPKRYPLLKQATVVTSQGEWILWRLPAPGTPCQGASALAATTR
jgi:4-amino-4-deoxy-L-arabinose transferase-like glycosyltransferase